MQEISRLLQPAIVPELSKPVRQEVAQEGRPWKVWAATSPLKTATRVILIDAESIVLINCVLGYDSMKRRSSSD